jgi:hypothetical protein
VSRPARRGSEHSRPVGRPAKASNGRRGSYRPRCDRPPNDALDAIDRHLLRATESDDVLARYRLIVREVRRGVVVVATVIFACALLGGVGVGAVVLVFGKSVQLGVGVGAAVGAAALVESGYLARRWLRRWRASAN